MNKLFSKLRALWDRIEAWFAPARGAHLYSEGREDEMAGQQDKLDP